MIDRGLSPESLAAILDDPSRYLAFVDIDWPNGAVRAHSGHGDRPFMNEIYKGIGEFGGISKLTEGSDDSPIQLRLTLKVLDPVIVGLVMNDEPEGREVAVHLAILDEDRIIAHELPYIYDGIITKFGTVRGDIDKSIPFILTLTCADWMENWNKPPIYADATNEAQQHLHPGDRIFDMTEVIASTPISGLPIKTIERP